MDRKTVVERLNSSRTDLREQGLAGVSLFGSMAREDGAAGSDIDLAVTLDPRRKLDLFRFAALSERLSQLLGSDVDLVVEPARNARLQAQIDRDRVRVF